jgi:ELWxxDGT repeat protein
MRHPTQASRIERLEPRRLLAADLLADVNGIYPTDAFEIDGIYYFLADDGVYGRELFKSDGTVWGTMLVKDITPGADDTHISGMYALGDRLLFFVDRPDDSRALWVSNGTAAGTLELNDDGSAYESIAPGAVYQGKFYFATVSSDENSSTLWSTDGTIGGTNQVLDLPYEGLSRGISYIEVAGDRLVFSSHIEVWGSDGTAGGTLNLMTLPGLTTADGDIIVPTVIDGYFYFNLNSGQHTIWKTDGTEEGTSPVTDDVSAVIWHRVGDNLYFEHDPALPGPYNNTLYVLEGITDELTGLATLSTSWQFTPLPGWDQTVFLAGAEASGNEVWITDGTVAGTHLLKDISAGPANSNANLLTATGSYVYFAANDGEHGVELWRTDGTEAGTSLAHEFTSGPGSSTITSIADANGRLVVVANGQTWVFDHPDTLTAPLGPTQARIRLNDRVLRIFGTQGDDVIQIYRMTEYPERFVVNLNGAKGSFNFADVRKIIVHGYEGDDNIAFREMNGAVAIRSMICAGAGNDSIFGNSTRDSVWGDAGDDFIHTSVASDLAFGGGGNDTILGGEGEDTLNGDQGADSVIGGAHRDLIRGGLDVENDTLDGGAGVDVMFGSAVFEIFFGGEQGQDPLDQLLLA